MTKLAWDQTGERVYETGVDRGVLYIPDASGVYSEGHAWNGLTTVTESPSGAEANKQYADNRVYANLQSAEQFGGTIEAFTYPTAWEQCDGSASPYAGVTVGQQSRHTFGLSYRTLIGNDLENTDYGYKIHLVYGGTAAPSEKAYTTVNDSPEAMALSWEITTSPVDVPGTDPVSGKSYKPTATLIIDSTKVTADALADLEDFLYGTEGTDPSLPLPGDVLAIFAASISEVTPTAPTYNSTTDVITIPSVTGVQYKINGVVKTGSVTITSDTIVTANPTTGYRFPPVVQDEWFFDFS
jgi:hypothetical protein